MTKDKLPPQNLDAERDVLGSILLERDAYDKAAEILRPECFYLSLHQHVFAAAKNLSDRHMPIDMVTVYNELTRMGLSQEVTMFEVSKLTNHVTSTANIVSYAKIVLERFLKRELARHAMEVMAGAYEESTDVFELIAQTEESFSRINDNLSFGDMIGIDQVLNETINQVHEWKAQGGQMVTGIPTGFDKLDRVTRGWQDTNLIYIAARPSVGKTAFSLSLVKSAAEHLAKQNKTVAVWSLEMSRVQLGLRMLSAESETHLTKLQTGRVNDEEMNGAINDAYLKLSGLNVKLDDTSGLTLTKLRSKTRKLKRKGQLGAVFIDYLQLMEGESKGNREQEVSKISRGLKLLAKELGVPFIALAQLSREVEKRPNGVPQLSDLRESGSIEQDADVVVMLYGESEAAIEEDASKEFIKHVKVAKQRDGMLATIDLHFDRYIQKFTEIKDYPTQTGNWKPIKEN